MNTQIATIEIFDNSLGSQYYILRGHRFDINFPIKWAVENLNENLNENDDNELVYHGQGPVHCDNCATFGAINNVFVGYCSNCALYKYNYSRGNGFNAVGVEQIVDHLGEVLNPQNSIWNTYMENVQQDQIGVNIVIIEEGQEEEGEQEPVQVEPEQDDLTDVEDDDEDEDEEEEEYDW
jgi:hypothetical protein